MTITDVPSAETCSPAQRVTKSLLGYGVLAGPFYIAVSLTQAALRPGFDLRRHQWSLLMQGDLGWVQVGLHRALSGGPGSRWAPRLLAAYGLSLVVAAIFPPDPELGFPVGTPEGPGVFSPHGVVHMAAGAVGFSCFAGACFVLARRYARAGRGGWAAFSRVTGAAFLAGFALIASTGGSMAGTLVFTAAVVLVWAWLSTVSRDAYLDVK